MMRKETILLITALLVISIFYRSIHFNNEKLFGNDPYFHLAVIKDAITKGEIDFTPEFSFFEEERPLFEPDGLYLATIIPHQILFKHLGLSIVQSFKIIPILFGITALTFFFLITRKVFGKKTALFSTLILSISVAHVYRSMAGHYRGDNFFLTITLASIYLFFLALDQKNTKKSILLYTISGILGGLNYFFWNGYPLYFIIMTIGIVAGFITHFLKGNIKKKHFLSFLSLGTALIVSLLLREIAKTSRKVLALSLEPLLIKYVLPASILFTATILLSERFKLKTKHKLILIIILLLIPSLFVLIFERDAINNISSTYLFENQHSEFYGTVSELTPPDLNFLWIGFTYFTFLIPLGIPFFFKKIDFKKAFLLTTFLISTLLVFSAKRYSFIGSAFFVLPAGLFLSWVYKKIGKTKKLKKIVPILPLIFFLPASILSFHYTQGLGFRINDSWLDAFNWMDANLEPGPVLVWWDMGSWEEGTLGWPSYMDSVLGQSPGRITDFSKFLLTNQTLPKWTENASYLILSSDLVNVWGNVEAAANLTLDSSIINFGYEGTNTQTNRAISQFAGRGYTIQVIEELDRTYSILLPDMQLSKTFVKKGNQVTGWLLEEAIVTKKLGASFYVDADQGYGVFFMNDLLESNYVQLMYMESLEGIKPVYYNGNVKVFEIGSTYFESTS